MSIGPTRATTFPTTAEGRKASPVASGFLDYFPDAVVAVAQLSYTANEQHNPGEPLHWNRDKSTDEADALMRHFLQRGSIDTDGIRHSVKIAWRALALLQKEIEGQEASIPVAASPQRSSIAFVCPLDGEQDCCSARPDNRASCINYVERKKKR